MAVDVYEGEERGHHKGSRSGQPGQTRPIGKRHVPFAALFLVAFVLVPFLETISWLIGLWDPATGHLIGWCWMTTGAGIALFAIGLGLHRRRATLVVWHAGATGFLWGSASSLTTAIGWPKVWGVLHFFGSLLTALSWSLYRIDAFRAAATGTSADGWGSFIGLARSRPKKITHTDAHLFVEVEHGPGETGRDVASAAAKIESAIGAISGGTTATPGERADTTNLTFEMADAFANWRNWPGPSHPGLSFAYPHRTAYYATGEDQWFSFAATKGYVSPVVPDFVSEMDTFVGAAGATGAGKSGFLNNEGAESLTRNDAIVCWLDREKFLQNVGWCASMLGMAADETNYQLFVKALRELARYRVHLFGQAALDAINEDGSVEDIGRKWSPELARETGEAAVLAIIDEADTSIQSTTWEWMAKRARSLGIFLLPATPRASTAEVPAVVRSSIATWKTYAVGDNYSQGFTLSQDTVDAGADPTKFREPGMHYLDRAPGVDKRKFPVKAREFKSHTKALRTAVLAARQGVVLDGQGRRVGHCPPFEPAVFSRGAIEAMGDFYWQCHPRVVLKLESKESLQEKYGTHAPPEIDHTPPGAFDAEQTMPLGQIQAQMIAVSTGQIQATDVEVRQAREILAANGLAPDGTPLATTVATPNTPRAYDGGDEDAHGFEYDDEEEVEEMQATATGTDLESDQVATIDHIAAGTVDAELARELAAVDPRQPINTRVSGQPVGFDAEDPTRPRLSPEDTQAELDRVIAAFAEARKMVFTNQEVMEAMRCELSASTITRRLQGLADDERIVPPGLKIERTDRTGSWLIVRTPPAPRPR